METWGAHGTFAARYAGQRACAGAGAPGRRIRGPRLLAACIVVGALLGPLTLGSDWTRHGAGVPAAVSAVGRGEPARIPAMDEGSAPFSGRADWPLDQQSAGEPFGNEELMVDVRGALEQMASEG